MNENKNIEEIIKEKVNKDYEKFYIKGMVVGYRTCLAVISKAIADMSSARKIKSYIKSQLEKIKIENSD